MRALRTALFLACAGLVFGSTSSLAQGKDDGNIGPGAGGTPECDITGYKTERIAYPAPIAIPDNNPAGIRLGPIFMPPDGDIVNDVVLELNMGHTWVGDLVMDLIYDPDCSGPAGDIAARVLCRPRGPNAVPGPPCGAVGGVGCAGDLTSTAPYFISDLGAAPLGVGAFGTCVSIISPGCYRQSDIGGGSFSIWRGLPKGGCWYLQVSDHELADLGSITSWAVYVRNQTPTPTAGVSWGAIKNIYR